MSDAFAFSQSFSYPFSLAQHDVGLYALFVKVVSWGFLVCAGVDATTIGSLAYSLQCTLYLLQGFAKVFSLQLYQKALEPQNK